MTPSTLKAMRKQLGLTQSEAAVRLGVSQPYWSLMEKGLRPFVPSLAKKAARVFNLPPTLLPVDDHHVGKPTSGTQLARELASLGYPGFAYMRKGWRRNPSEVLLRALSQNDLEARLVEALPWLVLQYPEMDHDWLVREAKLRNLTNRLGFVVSLALDTNPPASTRNLLTALLVELQKSRLADEQSFGQSSMSEAEKNWLRQHRPDTAKFWNLLTDWKPEFLQYGQYNAR